VQTKVHSVQGFKSTVASRLLRRTPVTPLHDYVRLAKLNNTVQIRTGDVPGITSVALRDLGQARQRPAAGAAKEP
jgi:hypothetical protein